MIYELSNFTHKFVLDFIFKNTRSRSEFVQFFNRLHIQAQKYPVNWAGDKDMKDLSVEAKIEAPFQLFCGKDDTRSRINRQKVGPIGLQGVVLHGAMADGVFAEHEQGALASAAESVSNNLAAVELPFELEARKKFISEWALKAKKASKKGGAFSVLLLPLAACGGGDSSSPTTGYVIDGYIQNAFLFRDEDGDGAFDAGERLHTPTILGNTHWAAVAQRQLWLIHPKILRVGQPWIWTKPNEAFTSVLKAPAGSTMVTPLTSCSGNCGYWRNIGGSSDGRKDCAGHYWRCRRYSTDPIASGNTEVYKAGVQVAGLMSAAGGGEAGLEVTKALATAVKTAATARQL